jgi:cytochrome c-type biogenesis protein CcmH
MTIFWIMAAGLTGLALLFALPPLLSKRDQVEDVSQDDLNLAVFRQQVQELDSDLAAGELDRQHYNAARRDLERELLSDVTGNGTGADSGGGRWAAALLAIAIPAAAVSLYLYLGDSTLIPRLEATASGQAPAAHPNGPGGEMPPLEVMVQRLAEKMEQNPENLDGWMMLGRTYFAIGQPERALYALEKAYGLEPEDPNVLVAYAEAVSANNDSELAGRPAELIQSALKIDPEHSSARWLEGLVSFQASEYVQASEQWSALLATFEPQSEEAAELRRYIVEARTRAGMEPEQTPTQEAGQAGEPVQAETVPTAKSSPPDEEQATSAQAPASASIRVEVSLAEHLWPDANVKNSLFVYAKATSGPPMPLAAYRARVEDLPLTVTLDDSMAMVPTMKLSGFPEVTVGARISESGQAMPESGDMEGEVGPVQPGQSGIVKVVIDRIRP